MKEKLSNKEQNMEAKHESTQSNELKTLGLDLDKVNSSEEAKIEEFNWEAIRGTPFFAVGTPENGYTLTFAGNAISPKHFKNLAEAEKEVARKPWDLIMVATAIYRDLYEQAKKANENNK